MEENNNNIVIYQTDDGTTKIDVKLEDETVWLSQQQMAELFSTSRTNIIEHINNIYEEEELDKNSTCQNFRQVQKEGNRNVTREIPFYNPVSDEEVIKRQLSECARVYTRSSQVMQQYREKELSER